MRSFERLWVSFFNSEGFRRFSKQGIGARIFKSSAYRAIYLARQYVTSYVESRKNAADFQNIQTYCTFIGHMKCGGSMLGSLLDAHPNAILADEVYALRYVQAGFRRGQIFSILLRASRRELMKGRVTARRMTPYSWLVPGQWQGRFSRLQVIGDSSTGFSTQQLAENPALLEKLRADMGPVGLKFIHVIRNPFDPMSVMMVRGKRSFENASAHYFENCDMLVDLRSRLSDADVFPVRYEDFVNQPEQKLAEICKFLGLEADPAYLKACAAILHKSPERSRHLVKWEPAWIEQVESQLKKYDFLAGYSFEN